jgi:hypothetical protein
MMMHVRVGALVVLGAALAMTSVARAQDAAAPVKAAKTTQAPFGSVVVTGYARSISAGVITMIDGTTVFLTSQTKMPDGRPTLMSQIRVTGTHAAQTNIDATEVDITK